MDDTNSDSSELIQLYLKYPLTNISLYDLYTYELIILMIYAVIIVFSFFTNLIAIIIFSFGRCSRSELSPFLLNLSVFNIIMTVYCIPFTILSLIFQRWLFARELCVVLDGFKTFSVCGVLLTLIAIAVDRYCAVKYPLAMKLYSVYKRNCIALLIIWVLSIALAVIWSPARSIPTEEKRLWVGSRSVLKIYIDSIENISNTSASDYLLNGLSYRLVDTIQCVPNKNQRSTEVKRSVLNSLQTYFVPLFILGFVYLRIAAMLWHRSNNGQNDVANNPLALRATTRNHLFTHESVAFKKKLKQVMKIKISR